MEVHDTNKKGAISMKTNERATGADGDRVTAGKLIVDMKVLASDTEQLLKATGRQTGQLIAQARANAQESLDAARVRVADLSDVVLAKTRDAGRATDDYVRDNPWQVMVAGAVAGLVLGIFLGRGRDSNS
jgi:ElaB/YqjD/DUF883 family membrane-anchored ribosome-binding protein